MFPLDISTWDKSRDPLGRGGEAVTGGVAGPEYPLPDSPVLATSVLCPSAACRKAEEKVAELLSQRHGC